MFDNLLSQALSVLGQHSVDYFAFERFLTKDDGELVPQFKPKTTIYGQMQPMPTTQKLQLGLNLNSQYATFFCAHSLLFAKAGTGEDQINYCGQVYRVSGINDWQKQNGWCALFLTAIPTPSLP